MPILVQRTDLSGREESRALCPRRVHLRRELYARHTEQKRPTRRECQSKVAVLFRCISDLNFFAHLQIIFRTSSSCGSVNRFVTSNQFFSCSQSRT